MASHRSGIVLFGHGARNPMWADSMKAIRESMRRSDPEAIVELAFLDFLSPTLPEAIDMLAAAGCEQVCVVPIFMAQSGHTKRDLPDLLERARARHPGLAVRVEIPIGEAQEVVDAIAGYSLRAARGS